MFAFEPQTLTELNAVRREVLDAGIKLASTVNDQSQKVIAPEWKRAVSERSATAPERIILAGTADALVGFSSVKLQAGGHAAGLSGGLSTDGSWRGIEFGANRFLTKTYYTHSPKGKRFIVQDRHTQDQFVSQRPAGPVYTAASNMVGRVASLWIQTSRKLLHDAVEARS